MPAPNSHKFPVPRVGPERRLNRMSERRGDKNWIAERLSDPRSRFMLYAAQKLAIDSQGEGGPASIRWLDSAGVLAAGASMDAAVFLGCDENDRAVFAAYFSAGDLARRPDGGDSFKPLVDLRSLAMQSALQPDDLALGGLALGLVNWHDANRCCGRCGGHTRSRYAGWRRECWACGQNHFPRMDPAIIVLITDGTRCLLGHHKRYAHKFYSTLAGFVEPGEDIEECVRREMREEVGLRIGAVTYLAAQPWPFPHSLMIGCWAEALTTEITLEEEELWDARWFTRSEVRQMLASQHPEGLEVPGSHSIAHALIQFFADSD